MTGRLATTPFGGGRMRADIFSLQQRTARQQNAIITGKTSAGSAQVDKWELLRSLIDARSHYGLSDRALTVLDALLSFHPDRVLDGSQPIIVFPSNNELSLRSRGMSGATLRRHIAALISVGLLLRRDSPNGKRFCRRGGEGHPEEAFGFDLAPLALAAAEIHEHAERIRAEAKAMRALRSQITLHLRDIAKTVGAALSEQRRGEWGEYASRLQNLSGRLSRAADASGLVERHDALIRLRAEVENSYLDSFSEAELSACDADNERHIQNSQIESLIEDKGDEEDLMTESRASVSAVTTSGRDQSAQTTEKRLTLSALLSNCPSLLDYARNGITSWKDARTTAELVRSMLGISTSAWKNALDVLGEAVAIAVLAAILERADTIRSPGGYLRMLTLKGRQGRFTIQPMLRALQSGNKVH